MSLIEINGLKVHYPIRGGFWNRVVDNVKAVDGVTFNIEAGETYGLVGESGSGKSTTAKAIIGLEKATQGTVMYKGKDVTKAENRRKLDYNRDVQMIFQDSLSSLNPRKRIEDVIAEPLRNFEHLDKEEEKLRVLQLLDIVGLDADALYKYPHQFSGGQRQRIGVARAVATHPKLIIADEPVSALDLSVQAQVLNFMKKIQRQFGISYLFISHDLGVVRHMCKNIAIMTRGRVVEVGTEMTFTTIQCTFTQSACWRRYPKPTSIIGKNIASTGWKLKRFTKNNKKRITTKMAWRSRWFRFRRRIQLPCRPNLPKNLNNNLRKRGSMSDVENNFAPGSDYDSGTDYFEYFSFSACKGNARRSVYRVD